jgi:hypothetical protein
MGFVMFLVTIGNLPEWALIGMAICPVFYLVFRTSDNPMLYNFAQGLGRLWLCGMFFFFVIWFVLSHR